MNKRTEKRKASRIHKRDRESINESAVPLEVDELSPYVKVVRPTRPSLTYDRME